MESMPATGVDSGKEKMATDLLGAPDEDLQSRMKVLSKRIQAQNGGIALLMAKAKALEAVTDKLRSDPAKIAIKELLGVVSLLCSNKDDLVRAYNVVAAGAEGVANRSSTTKAAVNDVGTQSPCWWDCDPQGKFKGESAEGDPSKWTEVVKRKPVKKKPNPPELSVPINSVRAEGKKDIPRSRVRSRPQAILVNVKAEEYPALARKIRGGVDHGVIGDSVIGMRQAKSGGLLIEVRGNQDRVESIRAEISRSAGNEVEVRALQQRVCIEIRDMDQWATAEEVTGALTTATGSPPELIKVVSLRRRYEGTQSALVSLPIGSSRGVLSTGRLRVGMVSCRIRLADLKVKCFRCFSLGHLARECTGPDRTGCCRRCGAAGHKVVGCNASPSAVSEFAKTIGTAEPKSK